ncbi:MAG: carboxypeptidase regulatory-like domain-containing protein [Acidobacteriota bacterium]|nr:carboxypeptidase regulatory-like domain-containing protein [Acidobacteriota bacterium]
MSKKGLIVAGMVVCLAAMPVLLVGQQQVGGLRVVLIDPSGGLIPGAEVEFRGSALIRPVFGLSDDQGLIVNNSLPPGTYTLTARCPGFQTAVKEEVVVRVGRSYSVEMALEVGRVESTIVVEGGGAAIDTFKSEAASIYTGEGLTNAAGGRDFTDYARFAPSVNFEALSGSVTYRGQRVHGISVDGSSGAENVFYVDGVDTTSMYNGLNNQKLRVETVEEFQLKTAGYEAEFGGAMGGVLSARTRSGSNEFHGSLLWYGSGSALTGRPRKRLRLDPTQSVDVAEYVLDPEDGDLTHEFGFTLGGPLWRDRVWFFGGLLSELRNRRRSVAFTSGEAGRFQRKDRLRSIPVKIDFQPAEKVRLMASAVADRLDWKGGLPHLDGTSNPAFQWAEEGFEYPGYTLTGAAMIALSPFLAVDARWGLNAIQTEQLLGPAQVRHRFPESPGLIGYSPDDALYRPRGFSTIGHGASFNTSQDFQKKSTVSLSGSYVTRGAGQHNLRFGWQFNGLAHDINDAYQFDYILHYYTRPYNMVNGTVRTSTCTGPNGDVYDPCGYYELRTPFGVVANAGTHRHALFVQDAWTVGGALTLNLGLRLEREEIPSFSDLPEFSSAVFRWNFPDKVAPRAGLAYDVLGNAKLKLFGSWGWFYDAMKLEMAQGSFGGFKWLSHYYLMDDSALDWTRIGGLSGQGNYPGTYVETRNWRIPSFEDLDPDLKPMRMTGTVAGFEYEAAPDHVISVRYSRKNLDQAIEDVGRQTPAGEAYYITNPGRGLSVERFVEVGLPPTPRPKRTYNAIEFRLRRALGHNWLADVAYVNSRLHGLYSGLGSSDENGRLSPNVNRDFDLWFLNYDSRGNLIDGPLGTDRTHQLKVHWTYVMPWDMEVGGFFSAMSGAPISRTVDLEHVDVMVNNRGSDGRNPAWTQTDLSLVQRFHPFSDETRSLEINLNVINLFNQGTPLRTFRSLFRQSLPLWQPGDPVSQVLDGYDYQAIAASQGATRDPRFLQHDRFLDPISARFGIRFVF